MEAWMKLPSYLILDDCAASKDANCRAGQLVHLGFSARHTGLSMWVLAQKLTSITASFRENVAAIVVFYMHSARTTKAIFDDYAGDLTPDEYKSLISKLKARKFSYFVFALRLNYFRIEKGCNKIYIQCLKKRLLSQKF